jgi:NADPH:quinone reductase-like Zn-dependent oxidoreductase
MRLGENERGLRGAVRIESHKGDSSVFLVRIRRAAKIDLSYSGTCCAVEQRKEAKMSTTVPEHNPGRLPQSARALRLAGKFEIDALSFDTVRIAAPGRGQVLVKMKAASLNYRDLLMIKGFYAAEAPRPRIIGSDGAGEVIAVGDGVRDFAIGDRVVGSFFQEWTDGRFRLNYMDSDLGGLIEGVLTTAQSFHQAGLVRIPDQLTYEEAATLPCAGVTAWHGLVRAGRIKSGDTVLILGTGGVAMFGLQIAKMHGARVIITSASDEKLSRAKALGADGTINYKKNPAWGGAVLELTNGQGADIVLESVGASTLPQSIESVRSGGHISLLGFLSLVAKDMNIAPVVVRNVRIEGINVGSATMLNELCRAYAASAMKPVIDRVFRFEQTREAFKHMDAAQHIGKIVISIGDTPNS